MTSQSRIAISISLIVHLVFFIALGFVQLYTHDKITSAVSVAFVNSKKVVPLRRSVFVRPKDPLVPSPRSHSPRQQHFVIRPSIRSSEVFYVDPSAEISSYAQALGQSSSPSMAMPMPSAGLERQIRTPIGVKLLNEPDMRGTQVRPRISAGSELFAGTAPVYAQPDMTVAASALERFLAVVRKKIEANKKYPVVARNAGVEGDTTVRIVILRSGELKSVRIDTSSGYEILDKAALESVRRAAPFPPIPKATNMNKIDISIKLVFRLSGR